MRPILAFLLLFLLSAAHAEETGAPWVMVEPTERGVRWACSSPEDAMHNAASAPPFRGQCVIAPNGIPVVLYSYSSKLTGIVNANGDSGTMVSVLLWGQIPFYTLAPDKFVETLKPVGSWN